MSDSNREPNRLANEKSPYLLQHAYNPVNWYPWGEEAFKKASQENKPIFLSIGYSTCHWCHVMEAESFEDFEVAQLLNKYFVSIKVDREERPDIDSVYMTVCQTLTGSGGWPLTIFMTSDKKPFFAGTYFPKENAMGRQGLISLLLGVRKAWTTKKEELLHSSDQITHLISQREEPQEEGLGKDIIRTAFLQYKSEFDSSYGGFGNAPKFPTPHNLFFLLRYWYTTKENSALEMVEKTLESMSCGGIYDHIGYGFSRYSTDRIWLVPHFEKMLYDNALLAIAYLETYQITRKPKYAEVAEQIFTYILRDMTSLEGGFYSAEDADSEGKEGEFYIWTTEEIKDILGEQKGEKFCGYFDITQEGNFEGKNIPNRITTTIPEEDYDFVCKCREMLFDVRNKRIHPQKDNKILTSWNGLMIAAMAIGGKILDNREYIRRAELAVDFIFKELIRKDRRLLARYCDGEAAILGYSEDYSFLIWGLLELYEATYKPEYLQKAIELNTDLMKYFWDKEKGGLFVYGDDGESLIVRLKEIYDGAIPSSNAVSALNLVRLARLTGSSELEEKAHQILKTFGNSIRNYPKGHAFGLITLLAFHSKGKEIMIVSDKGNQECQEMIQIVWKEFSPFSTSVVYTKDTKNMEDIVPFIKEYHPIEGKATAYVCENFSCQAPVTDCDLLKKMLQS